MEYRYAPARSYEDLAAGRVLLHRGGMPCFPVRAGSEIFSRCLAACPRKSGLTLYDPCCGGGYLLTVLGLLHPGPLGRIVGSDIDPRALALARDNLALLTPEGRARRRSQLREMAVQFGKESHSAALESLARLEAQAAASPPQTALFLADILQPDALRGYRAGGRALRADDGLAGRNGAGAGKPGGGKPACPFPARHCAGLRPGYRAGGNRGQGAEIPQGQYILFG